MEGRREVRGKEVGRYGGTSTGCTLALVTALVGKKQEVLDGGLKASVPSSDPSLLPLSHYPSLPASRSLSFRPQCHLLPSFCRATGSHSASRGRKTCQELRGKEGRRKIADTHAIIGCGSGLRVVTSLKTGNLESGERDSFGPVV